MLIEIEPENLSELRYLMRKFDEIDKRYETLPPTGDVGMMEQYDAQLRINAIVRKLCKQQ